MCPAIIAAGGNVELLSVDRVSETRNESAPPTACCTRKTGPPPILNTRVSKDAT